MRLVSNIFISFVGAGILGLPYAFRKSGINSIKLLVNAHKLVICLSFVIFFRFTINIFFEGTFINAVPSNFAFLSVGFLLIE